MVCNHVRNVTIAGQDFITIAGPGLQRNILPDCLTVPNLDNLVHQLT